MGYGDVLVKCPVPGQEELPAERLDVFLESDLGKMVLGQSVQNIEILKSKGMSENDAVSIALGPAIVRDHEGSFVRDTSENQATLVTAEAEPKKKLNRA